MSTLTTIATEAELFVNDFLSAFLDEQNNTYLNSAHLLTVRDENGEITVEPVSSNVDVYELIDEAIAETPFTVRSSDVVAVLTSGWAAPLNADGEVEGRPSEHAERRRVRLMSFVRRSDLTMVSVLRFGDSDDVVIDEGEATGSLAEALIALGDAGK